MLETKRLILRQYKVEDLEDLWEFVSQPNVGPRAGWQPHTDKEKTKKYLNIIKDKPDYFAIELKEENKVIGTIELMDCKKERLGGLCTHDNAKEIGYVLSEYYWSKGYMTEALEALLKYSFETLNVPVIYMCNSSKNIGSGRVQEKCGMKQVGVTENDRPWVDGTMSNLVVRRMTKEDYYETVYGWKFKNATLDDLDFIFKLKEETMKWYIELLYGWDHNIQLDKTKNEIIKNSGNMKIMYINDTKMGVTTFTKNETEYVVGLTMISPLYQGKGIGTKLINGYIKDAKDDNKRIIIKVFKENPAKNLYMRLGFETYYEDDHHLYLEIKN